jgi:arsenate reductase-like glutaredoxin family protein
MPTTRISGPSREVLRKLAEESGESLQAILDKAIEVYRRQRFLEENNLAFEALRANPKAWKAEQAQRKVWDIALADDLEKD